MLRTALLSFCALAVQSLPKPELSNLST